MNLWWLHNIFLSYFQKSKKRKISEVENADLELDKPKAKKKLNVLQKLENPLRYQEPERDDTVRDEEFSVPLLSKKLKKITTASQIVEKKKKKKSTKKRVIAEPPLTLPLPVWTTSGVFLEEPISPYKFQSTEYIPIQSSAGSTKFGVVVFEAKKKKKVLQPQQPQDFKTQMMYRNKQIRDGSMKNIRGLLSKQKTF